MTRVLPLGPRAGRGKSMGQVLDDALRRIGWASDLRARHPQGIGEMSDPAKKMTTIPSKEWHVELRSACEIGHTASYHLINLLHVSVDGVGR